MMTSLILQVTAAMDRLRGNDPYELDPFLDPAGAEDPNPLDAVAPEWGLPAAHPEFPARVVDQQARAVACVHCDGNGFVVTHEDGGAGYRPCFRCPSQGDAA